VSFLYSSKDSASIRDTRRLSRVTRINELAKSVHNKRGNYPGQDITSDRDCKSNQSSPLDHIPRIVSLPHLIIRREATTSGNGMSIAASFRIDPLIAPSVKSTSLNLRELLRHLIRRTAYPQMPPARPLFILFFAQNEQGGLRAAKSTGWDSYSICFDHLPTENRDSFPPCLLPLRG